MQIAKAISGTDLTRYPPRMARLLSVRDAAGHVVDQALCIPFRAPASYTGEDVVELHCHGGLLVTRRVMDLLLAAGARSAEPGEFTQRAFLNGKMDLTQAEAVMDLIHAQSNLALRAATEQLAGSIGTQAEAMRAELIGVLAHVEAYIDFPDEDISPDVGEALRQRLVGLTTRCDELLSTSEHGRILRHGARTVICGEPNVGKSSLLNLLLGFERAIVSPAAGTTRDTIEEVIQIHGFALRLVDTAGIRKSDNDIELQGINRSTAEIERADLILEVVDASRPVSEARRIELTPAQEARRVLILNKADLGRHESWAGPGVELSCATREGVEQLRSNVLQVLQRDGTLAAEHPVAINARHQALFNKVRSSLQASHDGLLAGHESEFVALELREALQALGEVTGRVDIEEILDVIFSSFCIGK